MTSRLRGKAKSDTLAGLKAHLKDTLGRRVRELRLAKKMNQRELAAEAALRQALISQIERAEATPTLDTLAQLAMALEVCLPELFE